MEKKQLAEIGNRLRQRRVEFKMTRAELAELADIGTGYYGQLEVGTSQMSIDTLIRVAHALHLPFEYILFGTGYEKGDPDPIIDMLNNCSENELKLAEKMLKLYLMKS
ncbi:MAG: helix-turn-helix domain-containing protein [Peptococcaceae bacterium]|nr:helix-turn-helix domain-containing protein [Peptococcaceae bacterium]